MGEGWWIKDGEDEGPGMKGWGYEGLGMKGWGPRDEGVKGGGRRDEDRSQGHEQMDGGVGRWIGASWWEEDRWQPGRLRLFVSWAPIWIEPPVVPVFKLKREEKKGVWGREMWELNQRGREQIRWAHIFVWKWDESLFLDLIIKLYNQCSSPTIWPLYCTVWGTQGWSTQPLNHEV